MRYDKVLTYLMTSVVLMFVASSCENSEFLDKPPGVDNTEDDVFSTERTFESFLFGTYAIGLHSYYPYNTTNSSENPNPTMCMTAPITDEAEMAQTYFTSQDWNIGSIKANDIKRQEDKRFNLRWKAIRNCNIIIERLPETQFTKSEINHYTAEALFIRALNNFEMFKRYGGMPKVDKRLNNNDDWNIPRSSVKDFVDYIIDDCEQAATLLEDVHYSENQRGRITRSACLALKAKTLLYAASPLFNTAEPYLPTEHPELVCYGDYDVNRWKLAADAAKDAIEAALVDGFDILDTDNPEKDYRDMWEIPDNKEIILAEKFSAKVGNWSAPWSLILPAGFNMNAWEGNAVCIPHNFIRKYENMQGEKQVWANVGERGTGLMDIYKNLDPRFRQTVAYNGSMWNNEFSDMQLYQGAQGISPTPATNVTGAIMHKLISYDLSASGSNYQMCPNGILFRVGELYLDYAEAMNEYSDKPGQEVYDAINKIRDRAGMPSLPANLTKGEMRDRIKNERDIELCFEDHRLWDIRRWMDGEKEGVMSGDFYKVTIYKNSGSGLNQDADYMISSYEKRVFNRNMYLHPIPEDEVNKGYMLQNPGW